MIHLKAKKKVAYDSPDHLNPWGTRKDNSRNRRFNSKLWALYPASRVLKILDLGCSGGGFVSDCLDAGHLAVGLEGSDFSQKYRRAEWAHIPEFLFTCDITEDFEIQNEDRKPIKFDVVTAWEVMEHLKEEKLDAVIENVKRIISPSGLWIMSISCGSNVVDGAELHQTIKPGDWWKKKFESHGFHNLPALIKYFDNQFVRGGKRENSEIFILSPDKNPIPEIPKLKLSHRIFDKWYGSKIQKLLKSILS